MLEKPAGFEKNFIEKITLFSVLIVSAKEPFKIKTKHNEFFKAFGFVLMIMKSEYLFVTCSFIFTFLKWKTGEHTACTRNLA